MEAEMNKELIEKIALESLTVDDDQKGDAA